MFITTTQQFNIKNEIIVKRLAEELSWQFIPRGSSTLAQLKKKIGDEEVIVIENEYLKFINKFSVELFFHPNLSKIRICNLLIGLKDRLLEVAEVNIGDSILDCTTGLATDSIVFSYAVGERGHVTTIESEKILYILAREGLKNYKTNIHEINNAMKRILTIHADHLSYMKTLPDKSIDIVYFDPMFRQPTNTIALTPIREIANDSAIKSEAIVEARRIARKKIILKEHRDSGEFERLGFELLDTSKHSKFEYGVINCKI